MSFVTPSALLLLLPLLAVAFAAWTGVRGVGGRLPGAWHHVVSPGMRPLIAARSGLSTAGMPVLVLAVLALIIGAMSRPGIDADKQAEFSDLVGRVVVLDVGADLARHRHALDAMHEAAPGVAAAVVAVSGDAYRIVPFTTDKTQIDRYVRVLNAGMMPSPGRRPHLGLARAEQMLDDAGYLVRQIVLLSALPASDRVIEIPQTDSHRYTVVLAGQKGWEKWAEQQGAVLLGPGDLAVLASDAEREARRIALAELPGSRTEFTAILIALAASLSLLLFRRRGT